MKHSGTLERSTITLGDESRVCILSELIILKSTTDRRHGIKNPLEKAQYQNNENYVYTSIKDNTFYIHKNLRAHEVLKPSGQHVYCLAQSVILELLTAITNPLCA